MIDYESKPATPRLLTSTGHSDISATLQGTYRDEHLLGYGFSLIKGETVAHSMKEFEISVNTTKDTHIDIRSISNQTEMQLELDLTLKGDFELDGTKVGLSAQYINKLNASTKTICLIAEYTSTYTGFSLAPPGDYQLNAKATTYFEEHDEDTFQEKYGQYYTAGYKYGSRFLAVYRCTTSDVSRFDQFKASISADLPQLFNADSAVDFSQLAKDHSVSIELSVFMVGIPSDDVQPPIKNLDPETVLDVLNWFIEHEEGRPMKTLFMSYSNVLEDFKNKIPVSPDILTRLRQTYQNYWIVKFLYHSVPDYYRDVMREAYSSFVTFVGASHSRFMKDGQLLDQYYHQSTNLILDFKSIQTREAAYYLVQRGLSVHPEPTLYHHKNGDDYFGLTIFDDSISRYVMQFRKNMFVPYRLFDKVSDTCQFKNGNMMIIGWQVLSYDTTGGYWMKSAPGEIFSSELNLYFESEGSRGIRYDVIVYYVAKSDFHFGANSIEEADSERQEDGE